MTKKTLFPDGTTSWSSGPGAGRGVCVGHGCGDGCLSGQCEVDSKSGEPLDRLSSEAISFCRHVGSQSSTVSEIVALQDPRVYAAIQKCIDEVNAVAVSNAQKIQKWIILEKDFTIAGGELGPTAKVKRHFITEKYKQQISKLYR
ncbi:long-chain-fatty-acid--CoA ligase ACSBG2-like [Trichechus manatus latirostris]|uniref:Long-chain-fatty-acid--CoA ligase ACSBG2-like n=1 Tax=Trichechus manatus latirostris TaxID=127582 RepID=A0A2Y9RBD8_TRIMA|nr:long-chain-fatty-acid--CoA ligase ACSBG2-like [Trichechus manatus latirostris]